MKIPRYEAIIMGNNYGLWSKSSDVSKLEEQNARLLSTLHEIMKELDSEKSSHIKIACAYSIARSALNVEKK